MTPDTLTPVLADLNPAQLQALRLLPADGSPYRIGYDAACIAELLCARPALVVAEQAFPAPGASWFARLTEAGQAERARLDAALSPRLALVDLAVRAVGR